MPSLDRLHYSVSRRRFVGASAGAILALHLGVSVQAARPEGTSYTFLALGSDARQPNEDQRTDIIMVSRVNVDAGTVRSLSIPRDLWVTIPGYGEAKINAAFQYGLAANKVDPLAAAQFTRATIEQAFGLQIDGVAVTDMIRFPQIVDAVGGIDIDNPYDLGEPNAATNLIYPKGPLHLNGDETLLYCRLRHQDGDGARVMRQHLVLEALLAKVQSPGIVQRLPELIVTLGPAVNTDISRRTQLTLLPMATSVQATDLAFTNIDSELTPGTGPGGAWIYEADWSTLPGYVQGWLDGTID